MFLNQAMPGNVMGKNTVIIKGFLIGLYTTTMAIISQNISGQELPGVPGYQEYTLTPERGDILNYTVWDPGQSQPEPVPLVLALHYGGDRFPYIGREFLELLVVPAFIELGALIVAPDCPGADWTDPQSTAAIKLLMDSLMDSHTIDVDRIVVTGFSMGGIGAWHMAATFPELFSACIAVAGRPTGKTEVTIPVYALHSRQDEIIDAEPSKTAVKLMKKQGVNSKFVIIDGPSHYQTTRFIEPLSGSIWWLESVWRNQKRDRVKHQ